MDYLLGIDVGTSGTKTALFDPSGGVMASQTVEYPLSQPQNGWAEQDPRDWWWAAVQGIRAVLAQSGADPEEIRGIGLSGQMHSLVMLDEAGEVLRPAILWCDGRTGQECQDIYDAVGMERYLEITANPALTGFTAGKLLWVRRHQPELYAKCRHILLPKDYIRYRLTGGFATEVSDASGMGLLDVPRRRWSGEVLEKLEIDPALLARVYESPEITGAVTSQAAAETGLRAGTIVVGGAGDNAAAAVGMGVVQTGRAFTTLGTSGVIYALSDSCSGDPLARIHTLCASVPGKWTAMSCTQAAGLSLRWLRDVCCQPETAAAGGRDPYQLMDGLAAEVPIGAERLLFLPYLMGERAPHPDPDCRGAFVGLSAYHQRAHLIRAVMEGVAYSQRECLDVFRDIGVEVGSMAVCGGGARSPLWRQMLCDLYACPIHTIASDEGPALGAAILAGVAAGVFPSLEEACGALVRPGPDQYPDQEASARYEPYFRLYKKLYADLKDSFSLLSRL